jgi:hypothetical protein
MFLLVVSRLRAAADFASLIPVWCPKQQVAHPGISRFEIPDLPVPADDSSSKDGKADCKQREPHAEACVKERGEECHEAGDGQTHRAKHRQPVTGAHSSEELEEADGEK